MKGPNPVLLPHFQSSGCKSCLLLPCFSGKEIYLRATSNPRLSSLLPPSLQYPKHLQSRFCRQYPRLNNQSTWGVAMRIPTNLTSPMKSTLPSISQPSSSQIKPAGRYLPDRRAQRARQRLLRDSARANGASLLGYRIVSLVLGKLDESRDSALSNGIIRRFGFLIYLVRKAKLLLFHRVVSVVFMTLMSY
jgi:hypothetical protein